MYPLGWRACRTLTRSLVSNADSTLVMFNCFERTLLSHAALYVLSSRCRPLYHLLCFTPMYIAVRACGRCVVVGWCSQVHVAVWARVLRTVCTSLQMPTKPMSPKNSVDNFYIYILLSAIFHFNASVYNSLPGPQYITFVFFNNLPVVGNGMFCSILHVLVVVFLFG